MQITTRGIWGGLAVLTILIPAARGDDPPTVVVKPTAEHALLARGAGVWDAEMKMFVPGADAPMVSKGTQTVSVLPGGLWVLDDFRMDFGGAPFHGRGQTGYDPKKKKYVGTWIDSMNPSLSTFEGTYDPKAKTLTMVGEVDDRGTGKTMKETMVTEFKDDDTQVFKILVNSPETKGEDYKVMEITYKRRKP